MATDPFGWQIKGDKKHSDFFHDYLPKIYTRRQQSGLSDLLGKMMATVVHVKNGEALLYLSELYLMTPYRLERAYRCSTHRIFILKGCDPNYPFYIVIEPHEVDYSSRFGGINAGFPRASEKTQVKYIGEIYQTKNLSETQAILEDQEIRFYDKSELKNRFLANPNLAMTGISYFTNNTVIYAEKSLAEPAQFEFGEIYVLTTEEQKMLEAADQAQAALEIKGLVKGLDHLATRVLSGDREHALLEFLSLTNYYFWGAYTIEDMNSSTNVCRSVEVQEDELVSPAKVFTANNTPFYTKSIDKLPSPTEDFVRNFGKRMHHLAYEIIDGQRPDGVQNIDYVVQKLNDEASIPFLAQIFGECTDIPDLKQIFSKTSPYSFLITEYVQRCLGFDGFFTKDNVAALTEAAGEDAKLKQTNLMD